jgi:hypothetical protein
MSKMDRATGNWAAFLLKLALNPSSRATEIFIYASSFTLDKMALIF